MIDTWTLVVVAVPLIALWVGAIVEVVRRQDLSGARTAVWILALLLVPLIALVAYVVVRPARAVDAGHQRADTTRAEAIVAAAERRQRGDIDDDGYRRLVSEATS